MAALGNIVMADVPSVLPQQKHHIPQILLLQLQIQPRFKIKAEIGGE